MKLNNKELAAIKELIYSQIDREYGIENIDPNLNSALLKMALLIKNALI